MHRYLIITSIIFFINKVSAQDVPVDSIGTDSIKVEIDTLLPITNQTGEIIHADSIETIDTSELAKRYSPRKALFYAAVLPGLGQIYNESYWKLPILYGTASVLVFAYNWNRERESRFRKAYLASTDEDPTTFNPFEQRIGRDDPEILQRNIDATRRNKEYMIILTGLLYLVSIVDAHVDAHLKGFDLSDEITFKIEPSFENSALASPVAGLALTLQFK